MLGYFYILLIRKNYSISLGYILVLFNTDLIQLFILFDKLILYSSKIYERIEVEVILILVFFDKYYNLLIK